MPSSSSDSEGVVDSIAGSLCAQAEPFALQVRDDSMSPEFWRDCIITVDPSAPPHDGSFVLVEREHEFLFRQLRADGAGWRLEALNPDFPSNKLTALNEITGVIVQRAGTRRRHHKRYDCVAEGKA